MAIDSCEHLAKEYVDAREKDIENEGADPEQ